MKTPIHHPPSRAWGLVLGLGLFIPGAAQGALQLKAQLPGSVSVFFPVPAEITLENAGNKPVVIEDFPRPHLVRVEIKKLPAGTLEYDGFAYPLRPDEEPQILPFTLAPGKGASFQTLLGARWGPDKEPLGAAFSSTGRFTLRFTYPRSYSENGLRRSEYVRSAPVTLLVTNVPARHQAALEGVRNMPHVVWLLHPKAAAHASQAELAEFEDSLRQHLGRHPGAPWAGLAKFALGSRVYQEFLRGGRTSKALADEATQLLSEAQVEDGVHRDGAARLHMRIQKYFEEERSRARVKAAPPAVTQAVENQFRKMIEAMARGETNAIAPLLLPEFRYEDRLQAPEWLAKLKRERNELSPFPLGIHFRTVSILGPEEETVLTADVTFESGVRKLVRRVAATYKRVGNAWFLTGWKNVPGAEP